MKQFAALLLVLGSLIPYSAFTQSINIPRAKAERIADSLRVLPAVRRLYLAEQGRTAAVQVRAEVCAEQVNRLWQEAQASQMEITTLNQSLKDVQQISNEWKGKARRRWWVSAALTAVLGGIVYTAVAH